MNYTRFIFIIFILSFLIPINSYSQSCGKIFDQEIRRDLPSSFNWCEAVSCPPVKNQGAWGPSAIFTCTDVFEIVILINDSITTDISEEYLYSCVCDSGESCYFTTIFEYFARIFGYFKTDGVVYDEDYPAYCSCSDTCPYNEQIQDYDSIEYNTEIIKQIIYNYGPVASAVYAGEFYYYTGGIFTNDSPSEPNHAVVITGWNDADSCWIIRNHWGTDWGENGYMRIRYDVSSIGKEAAFIDYKGIINNISTPFTERSIKLYPNPNNGDFTLEFTTPVKEALIRIFNSNGQIVKIEKLTGLSGDVITNVGIIGCSYGLYNVQVIAGDLIMNKNFVVE